MNFAFNLDFDELDEELQNQKIDEVITFNYNDGDLDSEIEGQPIHLDTYLEDLKLRKEVEENIEAHFPIYF